MSPTWDPVITALCSPSPPVDLGHACDVVTGMFLRYGQLTGRATRRRALAREVGGAWDARPIRELSSRPWDATLIKQPPRGLLQKPQTTKFPDLAVVARTPFWSFCAGQRRIGPGQITDGT